MKRTRIKLIAAVRFESQAIAPVGQIVAFLAALNTFAAGYRAMLQPEIFLGPPEAVPKARRADGSMIARTGEEHAKRVWSLMSAGKLPLTKVPAAEDSKHSDAVAAIDRWGNMAALVHTSNTAVWGTTGIFVDGISIPDSASFQQSLIAQTGPGKRLPDPTEPLIIAKDGKPLAALSSTGAGLRQKTVSVLLNLLSLDMGIKQAIDAPSLNAPKYGVNGSSQPQVVEGDFCGHLLAPVKKPGLEAAVAPNVLAPNVPRGYVISGYIVGAAVDPKGGFKGVAIDSLNGRALGY